MLWRSSADRQDDDPFFSEVSNFIDAVEDGPSPHILSSFEDAVSIFLFVIVWTYADIPRPRPTSMSLLNKEKGESRN